MHVRAIPIDRTSHLPQSPRQRMVAAAVLTAGFLWLMTPRVYGSFAAHLHKEDGTVFLTDLLHGLPLTETYTGYLHLGPRIAAHACSVLPSAEFATCASAASAATRTALALVILMVLQPYVRSFGWALAAACLPLFGSIGQQEVLGNITNLRWFLDVGVVFCLLGVFRHAGSLCLASCVVLVGATSDPLAFLAVPLALWRLLSTPGTPRLVPAFYCLGAITHLAHLSPSSRPVELHGIASAPVVFGQNMVVRSLTESVLGETGSQVAVTLLGPAVVCAATLALASMFFVAAWQVVDREQRFLISALCGSGLLIAFGTLCFTDPRSVDVAQGVARASRYALAPSVMIGCGILVALSQLPGGRLWRLVTVGTCVLLIISAVVDSRGDEWATRGPRWPMTTQHAVQECGPGSSFITVPVTPQGVPTSWTATVSCAWLKR